MKSIPPFLVITSPPPPKTKLLRFLAIRLQSSFCICCLKICMERIISAIRSEVWSSYCTLWGRNFIPCSWRCETCLQSSFFLSTIFHWVHGRRCLWANKERRVHLWHFLPGSSFSWPCRHLSVCEMHITDCTHVTIILQRFPLIFHSKFIPILDAGTVVLNRPYKEQEHNMYPTLHFIIWWSNLVFIFLNTKCFGYIVHPTSVIKFHCGTLELNKMKHCIFQ